MKYSYSIIESYKTPKIDKLSSHEEGLGKSSRLLVKNNNNLIVADGQKVSLVNQDGVCLWPN